MMFPTIENIPLELLFELDRGPRRLQLRGRPFLVAHYEPDGGFVEDNRFNDFYDALTSCLNLEHVGIGEEDNQADVDKILERLPELRQLTDRRLRSFALESTGGLLEVVEGADHASDDYLAGIEEEFPGWRFVLGWSARPPLQDEAFGILEQVPEEGSP